MQHSLYDSYPGRTTGGVTALRQLPLLKALLRHKPCMSLNFSQCQWPSGLSNSSLRHGALWICIVLGFFTSLTIPYDQLAKYLCLIKLQLLILLCIWACHTIQKTPIPRLCFELLSPLFPYTYGKLNVAQLDQCLHKCRWWTWGGTAGRRQI